MPRLSDAQWRNARKMWEEDGESLSSIAKKYGISVTTVQNHKRDDGWSRDDQPAPETPVEELVAGFKTEQTAPIHTNEQVLLAQRVAQLEAELAEAKEQVEQYRPTADVTMYTTPEEVEQVFGKAKLDDLAAMAVKDINVERIRQGLRPFDAESDPALIKPYRDRLIKEFLDRRTKWISPRARQRVVKMVHPNGHVVQIPVEQQLENEAGQAGTSLWKKRDKGFKLASPYICQLRDCWVVAKQEGGKFIHNGYCSPDHAQLDPYLSGTPIDNVTTSAMQGTNRAATLGFDPNRV